MKGETALQEDTIGGGREAGGCTREEEQHRNKTLFKNHYNLETYHSQQCFHATNNIQKHTHVLGVRL